MQRSKESKYRVIGLRKEYLAEAHKRCLKGHISLSEAAHVDLLLGQKCRIALAMHPGSEFILMRDGAPVTEEVRIP